MRPGDNAPAPAHLGLSDPRARPVPESTGHVHNMMVASNPPVSSPHYGQGPLAHPHSSLNRGEQCRHENCNARIQHGHLCQEHARIESPKPRHGHEHDQAGKIDHGARSGSSPAMSVATTHHHQPPATNGTHNPSKGAANLPSASPSSHSKRVLPDKMVARKSVNHLPSSAGRTGAHGTSKDSWAGPGSRPPKRQRTSADDLEPVILEIEAPNPAWCEPIRSTGARPINGDPGKAQNTPQVGEGMLRDSRRAGVPASAPPEWRAQRPDGAEQENTMRHPHSTTHPVQSNTNGQSHHIGKSATPIVPSQAYLFSNGHHKTTQYGQHGVVSSREPVAQSTARTPDVDQSASALAMLAKLKRNEISPAEMKEMIRTAQMQQLPRSRPGLSPTMNGEVRPLASNASPVLTGQNRNLEPKPAQAPPIRPAWRPSMPSMNPPQGWRPGMAASDIGRMGSDAGLANVDRQNSVDRASPQTNGFPTGFSDRGTRNEAPNTSGTQTNGVPAPSALQQLEPLQKSPKKVTGASSAGTPAAGPNTAAIPSTGKSRRSEGVGNIERVVAQPPSAPAPGGHQHHGLIMHRSSDEPIARIRRRERIFEAAKRAEHALRQTTAQMLSTSTEEPVASTQPKVNGTVNGVQENVPMPDVSHNSCSGTSAQPTAILPAPELRRLELVRQHDSDRMDGFIYGELNEPCRPMSRLFHIIPEERPLRTTRPAQNFAYIDPRVHWGQPRSRAWYAATQAKIRDRGNKKKGFGQAAARQIKRKHDELPGRKPISASGAKQQTQPPDRVVADPLWMAASKELDDMAAHYHADEKAKASGAAPAPRRPRATKQAKANLVNGDGPTTRRSERHNAYQHDAGVASPAPSERVTKTTPARRLLRTKTTSRPPVTVEDADESGSDDNDEDSTYGEGSGHRLRRRGASKDDHSRMDVDTTPTRTRSGR